MTSYGRQTKGVSFKHRRHTEGLNTDTDAQAVVISCKIKVTPLNQDCTVGSLYPGPVQ